MKTLPHTDLSIAVVQSDASNQAAALPAQSYGGNIATTSVSVSSLAPYSSSSSSHVSPPQPLTIDLPPFLARQQLPPSPPFDLRPLSIASSSSPVHAKKLLDSSESLRMDSRGPGSVQVGTSFL